MRRASLSRAYRIGHRDVVVSASIGLARPGRDDDAESALRAMVVSRCAAFNALLSTIGLSCSADTYVRMVGPLQFRVLLAREPITEDLIESIAVSIAPELTPR